MGAGIALRAAQHGFLTVLMDALPEVLKGAEIRIHASLSKWVEQGILGTAQKLAVMECIEYSPDLHAVANCDIVSEAVSENVDIKKQVFADLDRICSSETILASNTSSIPIQKLASATQRPDRVLGIHFMNPPQRIDLVEMIATGTTSKETLRLCEQFVTRLGCEVVKSKDSPGFVVNRILIPMVNEAAYVLQAGVASAEDIDRALVKGSHQPMGPLALADLIGLDVVLSILRTLHEEFKNNRYLPCPLIVQHVMHNRLGRKTGKGFFEYPVKVSS